MVFRQRVYICVLSNKRCTFNGPCEECLVGNYFFNFDDDKANKLREDHELW